MLTGNQNEDQVTIDQKARAILREGFLREISELSGTSCIMGTYERSTLKATFTAWKPDGSDILVSNLQTPAGIEIPSALLRTPDLLYVHFDSTKK